MIDIVDAAVRFTNRPLCPTACAISDRDTESGDASMIFGPSLLRTIAIRATPVLRDPPNFVNNPPGISGCDVTSKTLSQFLTIDGGK